MQWEDQEERVESLEEDLYDILIDKTTGTLGSPMSGTAIVLTGTATGRLETGEAPPTGEKSKEEEKDPIIVIIDR